MYGTEIRNLYSKCMARHWLDVGEFLVAFAIAYDWLFEAWSDRERTAIVWSMISLGLQKGLEAYQSGAWFLSARGNWNCMSNNFGETESR